MKGDIFLIGSWIIIILILTLLMLSQVLGWFHINNIIDSNMRLRTAYWIAHRMTGDLDCLMSEDYMAKNVLSREKIENAVENYEDKNHHSCALMFCRAYEISIKDFKTNQDYGFGTLDYENGRDDKPETFVIPVSIADENGINHAVMQVIAGGKIDSICESSFSNAEEFLAWRRGET